MAIRWNNIQAQRAARQQALSATPEPVAESTPINESVSNIDVGGTVSVPSWRILGVSPIAADSVSGEVPIPEPIERFPARPRPSDFTPSYQNLDVILDAALISAFDLEFEPVKGKWE